MYYTDIAIIIMHKMECNSDQRNPRGYKQVVYISFQGYTTKLLYTGIHPAVAWENCAHQTSTKL